MEFVIQVKGENVGRWVLAVDPVGERFLIVHEDQSFHWVPMADCAFLRAATPDQPRLVIAVEANKPQQIVVPGIMLGRNGPK